MRSGVASIHTNWSFDGPEWVPNKMCTAKLGVPQCLQVRVNRRGALVSKVVNWNVFWNEITILIWDLNEEIRNEEFHLFTKDPHDVFGVSFYVQLFHQVIKRQLHKHKIRSVCQTDYLPHGEGAGWVEGGGVWVKRKIFAGSANGWFYMAQSGLTA